MLRQVATALHQKEVTLFRTMPNFYYINYEASEETSPLMEGDPRSPRTPGTIEVTRF